MPRLKNRKVLRVLAGSALVGTTSIIIAVVIIVLRPRQFFLFERNISLCAQKVPLVFQNEGMYVRSGWDGPTGSFTSGELYGLKIGGAFIRLDITHDPIGAVKARLPRGEDGLIAALQSKKHFVKNCAAEELARRSSAKALPPMFRLLATGDFAMETFVLDLAKNAGASAIPFLSNGLQDTAAEVRRVSATALGELGSISHTSVPNLTLALNDPVPAVALASASALRKIDITDQRAIPKLMEFLKNRDASVKFLAVQVVGEYAADGAAAIPLLLPLLASKDPGEQLMAVMTLGQIGEPAQTVIPKLAGLVGNPSLTYAVIQALSSMGPKGVKALVELYRKIEPNYFLALMNALRNLGPRAEAAIPDLLRDLETTKGVRRALVIMALGNIGEKGRVVIPRLEVLMNDNHPQIRLRAAEALWKLDRRTNEVLAMMLTELRTWASNTNALLGKTTDATSESREQAAARIVGEIGPAAIEAQPYLELMTKSSYEEMRTVARKSLARIRLTNRPR